jgi:hypothetical protein
MSIYKNTPYTYLIGWSKHNKWYYGVRYSKTCHPSDLWVSYFTSSNYVKNIRQELGEPDVIQIRKTFSNSNDAISWECNVIKRMSLHLDERFINQSAFPAMNTNTIIESNKRRIVSEETRKKISKSQKGKIISQAARKKISIAQKGKPKPKTSIGLKNKPKSEDHKIKIAKANTGKEFTEERKRNISKSKMGHKPLKICCIFCKDGKEFDPGNFAIHCNKNH